MQSKGSTLSYTGSYLRESFTAELEGKERERGEARSTAEQQSNGTCFLLHALPSLFAN